MDTNIIIFSLFGLFLGISVGFFLKKIVGAQKLRDGEEKAKLILDEAKRESDSIKKEAAINVKSELLRYKSDFEKETTEKRRSLSKWERRLSQKEENIDKKVDFLDRKESEIKKRESGLLEKEKRAKKLENELHSLNEDVKKRLESIGGISREEAKRQLISMMENEARHEAGKIINKIEEETKLTADNEAKKIMSLAIQRLASEYVADETVSIVSLPNDEMKGRIIGREGRNIRSLEAACGVDLIIDDTPEAVVISSHNPIRREIARLALGKLIVDGRIHPARVEEVVQKTREELDKTIIENGQKATFDVGVHNLHPEMIKLLGRLFYRTSFSQNVYSHSIEVAFICGILATELGMNQKMAKRVGLLHDIGKAVDHDVDGPHATIGKDLARKYGEKIEIQEAISGHHDDKPSTIMSILVQAADALSAARPGTRKEMWENYIKRLESLEKIASSYPGVEKSFAISAGREIRVIVENQKISDSEMLMLTRDIAQKIEKDVSYPGQIKVMAIRETRSVEYAR